MGDAGLKGRSDINILFLSTAMGFGGAETQLKRMAILLRQRDWNVKIVSMIKPEECYKQELMAHGVIITSLDMKRGRIELSAFLRFLRILWRERPDILHTYLVHANVFGRLASLFAPVPVVISSARSVYEGGPLRDWWYRLTDFLCDVTTQVSQDGLKRYVDNKMVPAHKIIYIPNGVNISQFVQNESIRQEMRKEMNVNGSFVWLAIGRMEDAKDYKTLLLAFKNHCNPHCKIMIVGEGSLRREIEMLVVTLDLADRIRLLGTREDITRLMCMADAYVMSSAWEGMPNVILEAAAAGLPIVATTVGANSILVVDGASGLLVPPRNPQALGSAMIKIMALSPNERRLMGLAGRKLIETTYNLTDVVTKWEDLYHNMLKSKAQKPQHLLGTLMGSDITHPHESEKPCDD